MSARASGWRKRIGPKLDALLAETLRVAHASGALKPQDLARITVDSTVQPKAVTHPTDAKLMLRAIEKLGPRPRPKASSCGNPTRGSPSARHR